MGGEKEDRAEDNKGGVMREPISSLAGKILTLPDP